MAKKKKEDVDKQVELAIAQLDREFGKGAVMRLSDDAQPWPAHETGALNLDLALGIGGLPHGRIVEVFGPEGSGKSTFCLSVIANAQKKKEGKCLFVDVEHAIDPVYAKAIGVNLDELLLAQPSYGEAALQTLDTMVRTGGISVAVVDSVAALVPKAELDGTMADNHVGLQSRLMSQAMRKLAGITADSGTLIVFTNQIREKIGIMFGNPETTPGGRALKFYSSVRIDLRRRDTIQDKDGNQRGIRVKAKIIKNKMAPPLRISEFNIIYGKGIDKYRCIVDTAEEFGIVNKSGAWYYYGEEQLGQGGDNAALYLEENPELAEEIKKEIFNSV